MTTDQGEKSQPAQPLGLAPNEGLGPRPVAWMWMQATFHSGDVRGRGWFLSFSTLEPKGMPWMVDKLTPLYDQAALDAARMAGVHSVQEQTAVIVRAALELLEAVEGCDAFPPETMTAFRRVFGA